MNKKIYNGSIDRLRSPERRQLLEVDWVVRLCVHNTTIKTVLDIDTGSGIFAEAFMRNNLDVTGMDIN